MTKRKYDLCGYCGRKVQWQSITPKEGPAFRMQCNVDDGTRHWCAKPKKKKTKKGQRR